MKYFVVLILLLMLQQGTAQVFEIKSIDPIPLTIQDSFYFPRFTPRGDQLVLTGDDYKGLWLYSFAGEQLIQLNDYNGAGYEPVFLPDQERIVFRTFTYKGPKKYYDLHVQRLSDQKDEVLVRDQRNLLAPVTINRSAAYLQNGLLQVLQPEGALLKTAGVQNDQITVLSADQKMVVYENGARRELQPFGPAIYIWVSLSPDRRRILFTHGTEGTFIADLDGNILVNLGKNVDAPRWSPDGNWVLYMRDEDDGHIYTSSDIFVISSDGTNGQQLTRTDNVIEINPEWSPGGNQIAFHSLEGIVYLMTFQPE